MAYAIDTLVKAGGDDAHYRLLGAIQTLAESAGWTTLRFDTSMPERELILRSTGTTGTTGEEEITVGFKAYQNLAADYYNLLAATMVGYVPAAPFEAQPGIKTSGVPGHNQAVTYFLTANPRRIVGAFKVGSPIYAHVYVGKALAYARPKEFPSPLIVAGHFDGRDARRYSDLHWFPYKGRKGSGDSNYNDGHLYLRDAAGTWKKVQISPFGNGHANEVTYASLAGEYVGRNGSGNRCLVPAGTLHQPQPLELYDMQFGAYDNDVRGYSSNGNLYGVLDGVSFVSGFNNASENVLQLEGSAVIDQTGMSVRQAVDAIRAVNGRAFVVLQAGTGQAAAALTGACPQSVKLLSFTNAPIQWPAVYVLHVFDTPDEIYVVLRYNVDRHQHLNWGVSSMPQIGGSGLWCSGTFRGDVDGTRAGVKVYIDTNTGTQLGAAPYDGFGLGFFFASIAGTYHSSFIHCGLEGAPAWRTNVGGNTGDLLGVSHKAGLLHALPSQFNQATVLLPIDVLMARQAQGQTIVATLAHARFCRLDHLDLSAPLIYGPERWMAYPLHALHPIQRNGVGWPIGGQHTGTFGIALREVAP